MQKKRYMIPRGNGKGNPDALGCRPSTAGGQGATLSTLPLVPLTREPTRTQAIDPGISRSTLTPADTSRPSQSSGIIPISRGQVPHGWPMVHHSMATGFPIPRGCCLALSASLPFPCPIPLRLIPAPARSKRPMDSLPLWAVVRPYPHALRRPVPLSLHPVVIPHRVARYPVALAHSGLFHPGTVSCA